MSCVSSFFPTVGTVLADATAVQLSPSNQFRKGLLLSNGGSGVVKFAFGPTPQTADYISLAVGQTIVFDGLLPASAIWATGPGTIVVGEAS